MKLTGWTDNRVDSPVEYEIEDLATDYLASGIEENRPGWPLERKVAMFLMIDEHVDADGAKMTGKSLSWDPHDSESRSAFEALLDRIVEKRSAG